MKSLLFKSSLILGIACSATQAALVQPTVNYTRGAGAVFATSDGTALATGFLFYGTFSTTVTSASSAQEIEDSFKQLGLSSSANDGSHAFDTTADPDPKGVEESDFESKRGYLIVANNSDIGSATELAIVSNSVNSNWAFASDLSTAFPSNINFETDVIDDSNREIIFGSIGTFSTADSIQLQAIPEPSSFALLGLGAAAMLFRRKK